MRKTCLTIAGSDCSGGAGIQADLKTFIALGTYGMSALTALTAQNTCGVFAIQEITPAFLQAQLDAIFSDIPPAAVKVGMIPSQELIETVAAFMDRHRQIPLVIDPVMVATSGAQLITPTAARCLKERLLPLATVITPNLKEGEVLVGRALADTEQMSQAASELEEKLGCAVLIKGGHLADRADDLLAYRKRLYRFEADRIGTSNTHGTGCTLSSALTAFLALGEELPAAVRKAKAYVTGALLSGLNLGKGNGPLDHGWNIDGRV